MLLCFLAPQNEVLPAEAPDVRGVFQPALHKHRLSNCDQQ